MYISTRGDYPPVSASQAIKLGLAPGGGLFVPVSIPVLTSEQIYGMAHQTYQQVAQIVLESYLDDYSPDEIREIINLSYHQESFAHPDVAPVVKLNDTTYILELWHGPTAAFKDMALQIMPRLLSRAIEKDGTGKEIVILVATSGDTGKAALEGFKDVPQTKIIVFYPAGGVSKVQELQMTTTGGKNTFVVGVKGNFDDCQTAVKGIFQDKDFNELLNQHNMEFSSANSINWGRLLPQIVYYFWSYAVLLRDGEINPGEKVNFVVPTGNFGNILAGYYAWRMGLPVHKLICASNENKVLTDVLNTGVYDRRREFVKTASPSMDILISSNFERFLFELNGHNADDIVKWFKNLAQAGIFELDGATAQKMRDLMVGDYASDEACLATIREVFEHTGYTLDTHTAVGVKVYQQYVAATKDTTKTVVDATANPYKFNAAVLEAIAGTDAVSGKDEFAILDDLHKVTGLPMHRGLENLDQKTVLHDNVVEKYQIREQVKKILGL